MNKNYNYTRNKLILPEYGRHIQEMVDSLLTIEDRVERNRQARAVIAVMGNLNPLLRDTADFTHKLWDHLFIISDFKLDVDSPYPQPTREELTVRPRKMSYNKRQFGYKHYGRYTVKILRSLANGESKEAIAKTVDNMARFMRIKSFEFNQEHPNNEMIIRDIKLLSNNSIEIDEVAINNIRSDYKGAHTTHQQRNNQRPYQKGPRQQHSTPHQRSYAKGGQQQQRRNPNQNR